MQQRVTSAHATSDTWFKNLLSAQPISPTGCPVSHSVAEAADWSTDRRVLLNPGPASHYRLTWLRERVPPERDRHSTHRMVTYHPQMPIRVVTQRLYLPLAAVRCYLLP